MIFISLVLPIFCVCLYWVVLTCFLVFVCYLNRERTEQNSSGRNEVRSEIPGEVTRRLSCEDNPCLVEQSASTVPKEHVQYYELVETNPQQETNL